MSRHVRALAAALVAIAAAPAPAGANPQSETLRVRAASELYNLDRERAIATYREAVAADPARRRGAAGSCRRALARGVVPPRHDDRRQLSRRRVSLERQAAAAPARAAAGIRREHRPVDRSRAPEDRGEPARPGRALRARRGGRLARVVRGDDPGQRARGVRLGPRSLQRPRARDGARPAPPRCRPDRRHLPIPGRGACRCRCGGWPTPPVSAAAAKKG